MTDLSDSGLQPVPRVLTVHNAQGRAYLHKGKPLDQLKPGDADPIFNQSKRG